MGQRQLRFRHIGAFARQRSCRRLNGSLPVAPRQFALRAHGQRLGLLNLLLTDFLLKLRILHSHQHTHRRAGRCNTCANCKRALAAVLLFALHQIVVGAADHGGKQTPGLLFELAHTLGVACAGCVRRQRLNDALHRSIRPVYLGQAFGKRLLRRACRQHGQHTRAVVMFQKICDLPLHPQGFGRVRRADDNEKLGVIQRGKDVARQIHGNGQLVLITEHNAQLLSARLFAQGAGYAEMLNQPMQPARHSHVHRAVAVADKSPIVPAHRSCLPAFCLYM